MQTGMNEKRLGQTSTTDLWKPDFSLLYLQKHFCETRDEG